MTECNPPSNRSFHKKQSLASKQDLGGKNVIGRVIDTSKTLLLSEETRLRRIIMRLWMLEEETLVIWRVPNNRIIRVWLPDYHQAEMNTNISIIQIYNCMIHESYPD